MVFLPQIKIQNGFNESVQNLSYKIFYEPQYDVMYKNTNCEIQPIIDDNSLGWVVQNVKALVSEPYKPLHSLTFPLIELKLRDFVYDNYHGSWESWDSFGEFLFGLHQVRQVLPKSIIQIIHTLTKDCKTDSAKIAILYKYLQENYRYVSISLGIGGWQPFSAMEVSETKYGDCKALSNYMYAMLKHVDIQSYPAIIMASETQPVEFDTSYAYSYFNHEILYIPSEDNWLDCTSPSAPSNYINYWNSGRTALLLTPNGGILKNTPILDENHNIRKSKSILKLIDDTKYGITTEIKLYGKNQENIRYINSYSDQIKQKQLQGLLNNSIVEIVSNNINVIDSIAKVTVFLNCEMSKPSSNKSILLDVMPLYNKSHVPKKINKRLQNLSIRHAYTEIDTFLYQLTDEFIINELPENQEFKSIYGQYSIKFKKMETNLIRIIRKNVVFRNELPSEHYATFREYFLKVSTCDKKKLYVRKN